MTVKYRKFQMPETLVLDEKSASSVYGRFIAEPLEKGYGPTLGNSLRRVLLTSLEAPAIIGLRIEGVPHEYTAIDGVIEDMVHIVLNFKGALLRRLNMEESDWYGESRLHTTILEVTQDDIDRGKGQFAVNLGHLVKEAQFEVVNPSLHLFTVTKPFVRQIDLRIAIGRGYVSSERHQLTDRHIHEILLDGCFSPVRLVNYHVEKTRVGQDTDYDKLILEVHTDGRVRPGEALAFAAQIMQKYFELFSNFQGLYLTFDEELEQDDAVRDEILDKLSLRINNIELSVRSTNCLSGADIAFIGELVVIPERKMLDFRNFGKKSLSEIRAKLLEFGLRLGMEEELKRYGITEENVRERILEHLEKRQGAVEVPANEAE